MSIQNILVSYNGDRSAQGALKTALVMAKRYDAHLTAVLAHGLPNLMYSYGGHLPQAAMDQLRDADKQHREEAEKLFWETVSGYPSDKTHYLDVHGDADEMLMEVALGYDLVVIGAEDKDADYPHMIVHPDVVARDSGKPVVVVPLGYDPANFNESVLLAWDGKRAASRAMGQAIRLLKPGAEIAVLTVGSKARSEAKALPAIQNLERHGFAVKLIARKGKKVAKVILNTAEEENVGMLVMGAYEHAKLAQDLFGGITNTVLKKATVPVLLVH